MVMRNGFRIPQAYTLLSNLYVELLAIREGLEIALLQGYSRLEIEYDSIVALSLLKENTNAKLSFLVNDCRFFILRMDSVKLRHIFREENVIADHLASMGRTMICQQTQLVPTPM